MPSSSSSSFSSHPKSFHSVLLFIGSAYLRVWGVGCLQTELEELRQGGQDAEGRVKTDQVSQGAGADWAPLIPTACLQDVFLRPGLAFQQLLRFQGMGPLTYCLCNGCRFHKRKERVVFMGLEFILQAPRSPRRSHTNTRRIFMYLSIRVVPVFPCAASAAVVLF